MKKLLSILLLLCASPAFAQVQNTLLWDEVSDNEQGFIIERKAEICAGPGLFAEIARTGANVVTYVDKAVAQGQFYCYRVAAFNTAGQSAYSNLAGRLVPFVIPVSPTNLRVQ